MTKSGFYKSIIDIQKKTGQGLSGIVKVMGTDSSKFSRYLDEFIEEGFIKACHTGGSIGHPESNIFYIPTKGYNVWEDHYPDNYSRHNGRYLTYVRFYLGALGDSDNNDNMRKALNPTMKECWQNVTFMEEYVKWLRRNEKALEEMITLDDFYSESEIEFSPDEVRWVKSKSWYEENKTIGKCYSESRSSNRENEIISISRKLIELYKSSGDDKYKSNLKKAEGDIIEAEKDINTRRKLHDWFEKQDTKSKIQDCFKF